MTLGKNLLCYLSCQWESNALLLRAIYQLRAIPQHLQILSLLLHSEISRQSHGLLVSISYLTLEFIYTVTVSQSRRAQRSQQVQLARIYLVRSCMYGYGQDLVT